ncbi:hypothetical protein QQX98_011959 [Neonectria punicea]|uniref:Uncharacterized protein n=1 Tax=Neonectria punicea TaxID=979145 RepID=A0ABR1GKD8_9HYPO
MPGPPTPVSSCPLRRLEIRDGFSPRIYHTYRPSHIFTLTLEGERPVGSETGVLILLINHGQQRLISIRLHDLLKGSLGSADIISVEKQRNELCIKIPGQGRAIIAQFEEKRDFSVAVYMLEKTHIRINNSITSDLLTYTAPSSPTDSLEFQNASSLGPRLSSITPLPRLVPSNSSPSSYSQPATSFTSMLNSPLPPDVPEPTPGLSTTGPQFQFPQRINSLPTYASASCNSYVGPDTTGQQLNPYNMFLGRSNSQVHTPRVSSPLRKSLNPEEDTGRGPGPPFGYSPYMDQASLDLPTFPPDAPRTASVHDGSPYPGLSKATGRVPLSPNAHASPEPSSQRSDQSFRDLMPRPRELPFSSRPKMSELKKTTSSSQNSPTKKQSLPRHESDIKELEAHSEAVDADSPRRRISQATNETPTPKETRPQTTAEAEEHTGSTMEATRSSSPLESHWSPVQTPPEPELTILVTEPETLKQLNQMTAKLFEQYEADIASGVDEEASAKFYMDRIMDTRRDFWSTKLGDMLASQWPMSC